MKNIYFILLFVGSLLFTSCDQVTSIKLDSSEKKLSISQLDTLIATTDGNGEFSKVPVSWTSSNSACVTVNNGIIKGLAKGTAVITAKSGNKTTTCSVTVTDEINMTFIYNGLWYFGDTLQTDKSNLMILGLANDKLHEIDLWINVPLNSKTLNEGLYRVYNDVDFSPYSILPGITYEGNGQGSWYSGLIESELVGGQVLVSNNAGNYEITVNLIDEYGNNIKGVYRGTLEFYDKTVKVQKSPLNNKALQLKHDIRISKTNLFR